MKYVNRGRNAGASYDNSAVWAGWRAEPVGGQFEFALLGKEAYGDWRADAPGIRRHIRVADLPTAHASTSASNGAIIVEKPPGTLQGSTLSLLQPAWINRGSSAWHRMEIYS